METCKYLKQKYQNYTKLLETSLPKNYKAENYKAENKKAKEKKIQLTTDIAPIFIRVLEELVRFDSSVSYKEKTSAYPLIRLKGSAIEKYQKKLTELKKKLSDPECQWRDPLFVEAKVIKDSTNIRLNIYYKDLYFKFDANDIKERVLDELKLLYDNHFINRYQDEYERSDQKQKKRTISFEFALPQLVDVLTKEGEILEVYTYYKCKETNFFDDISSSMSFKIEGTDINNEFDCLLT